jgi:hypothetical protein
MDIISMRHVAWLTHPVIASLDHPLSAARKEGFKILFLSLFYSKEGQG